MFSWSTGKLSILPNVLLCVVMYYPLYYLSLNFSGNGHPSIWRARARNSQLGHPFSSVASASPSRRGNFLFLPGLFISVGVSPLQSHCSVHLTFLFPEEGRKKGRTRREGTKMPQTDRRSRFFGISYVTFSRFIFSPFFLFNLEGSSLVSSHGQWQWGVKKCAIAGERVLGRESRVLSFLTVRHFYSGISSNFLSLGSIFWWLNLAKILEFMGKWLTIGDFLLKIFPKFPILFSNSRG